MDAKDYQKEAARTLITNPGEFTNDEIMLIWGAMGLAGEAGEVVELVKKGVFHRHGLDRDKLKKELGDVLWYVASICTVQGFDMGEIMAANIEKLATRYPNGFTTSDSVKRVDVHEWTCKCGVKFQGTGFCDVCLMGYTAPSDVKFPSMEICQCGHTKRDHTGKPNDWCFHEDENQNVDCECLKFVPEIVAPAPVEMCECGHDESWHNCDISASHPSACTYMHNKGLFGGRGCKCLKYTPIPALLPNQNKNP